MSHTTHTHTKDNQEGKKHHKNTYGQVSRSVQQTIKKRKEGEGKEDRAATYRVEILPRPLCAVDLEVQLFRHDPFRVEVVQMCEVDCQRREEENE